MSNPRDDDHTIVATVMDKPRITNSEARFAPNHSNFWVNGFMGLC